MRTTVRLRDDLLQRAKRRAAAEGRTLTSIIEEGVTIVLSTPVVREGRPRVGVPVSGVGGGTRPGVDLNRSSDLESVMDDA